MTAREVQFVPLPGWERLHEAVGALRILDPASDPQKALSALNDLVVAPLRLPPTIRRVLVSPVGELGYVPFAALLPGLVVVYVPSATTYRLLREERRARGEGVLALGDPDYGAVSRGAQAVYYAGRALTPLPATRKEVEAIATKTLLGADASEAGLRHALGSAKRWRAVHFACHGLLDAVRPARSSLVLTSSGEDDGFLTALEVFQLKVRADLVVLSACETAKGEVVKTEGIIGLTRAFMFAGAPRVLCSLWKVDDHATRALMEKFYELWNPQNGSEGLGCAAALKKAQAFVREHPDHPEWKHPYYWAAWVLWGLGS